MDHYKRLKEQARWLLFGTLLVDVIASVGLWQLSSSINVATPLQLVIFAVGMLVITLASSYLVVSILMEPVQFLWQAIVHVSPSSAGEAAPNLQKARMGRELITSLCLQVYQLASTTAKPQPNVAGDSRATTIVNSLPLPLLVMDKNQMVIFANDATCKYLGLTQNDLVGKNASNLFELAFSTDDTLDNWLQGVRGKTVTATHSWDRVRLKLAGHPDTLQMDMAAHYSQANTQGVETVIAMFDHSKRYGQNDDSFSFIALAVHELRTPLTLLRGYVEVFQDEFGQQLTPDMASVMQKIEASGRQLSAFINNILNVARVDANQLTLQLHEESWPDIVTSVVQDLSIRAQPRNIVVEYNVSPNLPSVGADRLSIYEVLSNLLDNAIKYSKEGQKIIVSSALTKEGLVETTVQDFGFGIPVNVLPNLFEKFYRNHQTSGQVSGTGLGLYLSKAIVTAHGGNIWVRSKEGQGTIFGFTLLPYTQLADEQKNSDNKGIVRVANGWIKNHSLYRR